MRKLADFEILVPKEEGRQAGKLLCPEIAKGERMTAKKTMRIGKTGVKKLTLKKDTIRDLDARGKGRSVKGGRNPNPIPIPYPNTG